MKRTSFQATYAALLCMVALIASTPSHRECVRPRARKGLMNAPPGYGGAMTTTTGQQSGRCLVSHPIRPRFRRAIS